MHFTAASAGFGLLVFLASAMSSAGAATIYRWVDDQGKTHYSEVVPEKYIKRATPVVPAATAPSIEDQREASVLISTSN